LIPDRIGGKPIRFELLANVADRHELEDRDLPDHPSSMPVSLTVPAVMANHMTQSLSSETR
jgi:hypothetical protein